MAATMASPARFLRCEASIPETASSPATTRRIPADLYDRPSRSAAKIVLQPRLCTLRSYAAEMKTTRPKDDTSTTSFFFQALSEYIDTSRKSHDFEIVSGRFAMMIFAATVAMELSTGNSVIGKMDLQGIEETGGACFSAVALAALFAWLSSSRRRLGNILTVQCTSFIDSLIDQIVDGLFYDTTE